MNEVKDSTPKSKLKTDSKALTLLERLQRLFLSVGFVLFSLALVIAAIAFVALYFANMSFVQEPVSVRAAGRVAQVQLHVGFFSRAFVETDQGYFSLTEGVSLDKGEAVTVQERANGRRLLCDSHNYCTPLLQILQPRMSRVGDGTPGDSPADSSHQPN